MADIRDNSGASKAPIASGGLVTLKTRSGFEFSVRPTTMVDEPQVAEFFTHVSPDDLRFRFLSGLKMVDHDRLAAMLCTDRGQTRSFLALSREGGKLVAVATLAVDDDLMKAEVAISVRTDHKHRGIAWTLLKHIAEVAKARGVKSLESMEIRESHEAIALEREMGFVARACDDDPSVVILALTLA